jgi:hypothetical protein
MSRMVMKNGDIVNLETYDWNTYQGPALRAALIQEIRAKANNCINDYPGQKIIFCFNSEAGAIPDDIKKMLQDLHIEIQTWP